MRFATGGPHAFLYHRLLMRVLHAEITYIALVPAAILALLAYLAYRRPVEAGWGLLVIGLIIAIYSLVIGERDASDWPWAIVLATAPLLLSGLMLLAGNWLARGHLQAA